MTIAPSAAETLVWHRVLDVDALPEGRVTTVTAGHTSIALTHVNGTYGALDNRCPHQGGPLGEGTIERGKLRCPWHGYDYCPLTGGSAFGDSVRDFPVEVREDGGIWVAVPGKEPHARTVSDAMAETMVAWGVRHVFGMVGHSNLGLADALRRREEAGELRFIGIRHEGAAAFAASAYGKLTGRPAACLTIAGPGATNLLTGLWDAKADRAPVLALTGQVDTKVLGKGAFQDVDLAGAFGTVAAWSATVLPDSDHPELMALAIKHALLREAPTHLVFPDEVQNLPAPEAPVAAPAGRVPDRRVAPSGEALDRAVTLLSGARRPVIVAGHGAAADREAVRGLAERLRAPVITTFRAKGLLGDDHPLAGGVLGRSGTPVASWLMNEADLLVVLGASFANHTGIYPGHPIVQVDRDPQQLGRFHPVEAPVLGDVGVTIAALVEALERTAAPSGGGGRVDQTADVADRWALWRAEKASRAADDRGHGVASAAVFAALNRHAPTDAVLCVDVGNNAYAFGRYFEARATQDVLMSGYLGSIGFAYPAALGAWAATDGDRPVVAISGDGGFAQYMAELTTAVKHGMRIVHVLLDNGQLGKISKEQRAGEWDVWQTSLHNPDFAAYARDCGALGLRVERAQDLDGALAEAFAHDGPATVVVRCDADLV
ncbi:thiamine pyrophosphate-dependent enzyme [Paraconexibacter sp.]|uniref:thiamine pyrophosphate-dependent enzyme n=1 Tax=Paraconexibacter sp. TaxID=2949640 RepID=UPI00356133FF